MPADPHMSAAGTDSPQRNDRSPSRAATSSERDGKPTCLIVTASRWPTHAALPRLFVEAGFEVTQLGTRRSMGNSRFVTSHVPAPADPSAVTDRLRDHLRDSSRRYTRIVVCDEDVLRMSAQRYAEELRAWYPVPIDRAPVIASKEAFLTAAAREGVPTSQTIVANAPGDVRVAAERFGFPLVAKSGHGHGGLAILRLNSNADIDAVAETAWPLLVQPFVIGTPGTSEVLYRNGEPVRWFSSEMLDCFPAPFGPSTSRRIVEAAELEPALHAIGRATGFDGLGGVDWIRDSRTGRIEVIELNPRPQTCYDLLPETRDAFALALSQISNGVPVVPSGAIATGASAAVPQFPQHVYYALFSPGLPMRERATRAIASLRRIDRSDPRVAWTHLADVWSWIYARSPLGKAVRSLKRSTLARNLKARLRRR